MTEAGEEYWSMWVRLGRIDDGDEHDALCDRMDASWYKLTESDRSEFTRRVRVYNETHDREREKESKRSTTSSSTPFFSEGCEKVLAQRDRYVAAIRKHMNYRGDDRCCGDDHELYSVLPEGDTRPVRETLVMIENCQHFIECRQTGREYVSPQRRIEELELEVLRLQGLCDSLADRCHAQSDTLTTLAMRSEDEKSRKGAESV